MTSYITPKITNTVIESYFEIQYKTVWDDDNVWYRSNAAGDNYFETYNDACMKAKELTKEEQKLNNGNLVSHYKIVEKIISTQTKDMTIFLVKEE
jgi:hypothetical protein